MNNITELSDEEKENIFNEQHEDMCSICGGDLYKYINSLLNDRYNKGKEEEKERLYNLLKKKSLYYTNDNRDLEDIIYFSDVHLIFNQK